MKENEKSKEKSGNWVHHAIWISMIAVFFMGIGAIITGLFIL